MRLRWNHSRTLFKPGPIQRLTTTGEQGWVIPEFAWDPTGQRLLWTQNRYSSDRRVDQACVTRKIRADIIARLSGVTSLAQIPFDIVPQIHARATELLQDPRSFAYQGLGCGGDRPDQPASFMQQTRIAHY
jgi:hypothetical protein